MTIDDRGGGAGLSFGLLATFDVERFVNALKRPVIAPKVKIIVQ